MQKFFNLGCICQAFKYCPVFWKIKKTYDDHKIRKKIVKQALMQTFLALQIEIYQILQSSCESFCNKTICHKKKGSAF